VSIIHLLTGYEGNSTFIVLKVPTSGIVRVNAEDKVDTEGTKKVILPEYQVFYYTEQLCNSKF
jgi:hypothetical protein